MSKKLNVFKTIFLFFYFNVVYFLIKRFKYGFLSLTFKFLLFRLEFFAFYLYFPIRFSSP